MTEDAYIATSDPQDPYSPANSPPLTPTQHGQQPQEPLSDPHHLHHHHHRSDLQFYTQVIPHSPTSDKETSPSDPEHDNESSIEGLTDRVRHLSISVTKSTPQPINKPITKLGCNSSSTPPFKHSHDHQVSPHFSHSPTQIPTHSPLTQPSSYDCSPQIPPGSPPFLSPILSPVFSPATSMSPSMLPSASGSKRHIWLIRHGERADLADKTWAATGERRYDPPLTRMGVLTAYVTGKTLSRMRTPGAVPQLVVTSPFLRCLQTATQIARTCNECPVLVEPCICEFISEDLFNGVFPGPMLTQEEYVRDYCSGPKGYVPTFLNRVEWHAREKVPDKWESRFDLQDRCRDFCEWLDSPNVCDYESIAIVTHGTCLVMMGMYLDETKAWPDVETPYCCVSHFVGQAAFSRPESPTALNISSENSDYEEEEDENESFGDVDCGGLRKVNPKKTNWKAVLVCSQKHLKRK